MKKIATVLLAILAVAAVAACVLFLPAEAPGADNDYLRIHVRANSNGADDQKVKYEVKDEVVKFLTPHVADCVTKQAAISVMGGLLKEIEGVCDKALKARGYNYGARAQIKSENFPTRVYGDLTLEEGVYDALIIELGTGKGDNWWCVIYPPLCFTSGNGAGVEYRSAIYSIIAKFFAS